VTQPFAQAKKISPKASEKACKKHQKANKSIRKQTATEAGYSFSREPRRGQPFTSRERLGVVADSALVPGHRSTIGAQITNDIPYHKEEPPRRELWTA
jgi:hypothetical protein